MRLLATVLLFIGASIAQKQQRQILQEFAYDVGYETLDNQKEWRSLFPVAVQEDADIKFVELVTKYNYPVESYHVDTHDGYVLNVHRIPYGNKGPSENRPVVFLMHGILESSADWIIPGPGLGLGYLLADRGYDVWFGNARGNFYSRNHSTIDPDSKQFWDFSWHQIGITDLPAMINFALEKTGQESLFYIGHSQGTTAFFVMCSERPEMNNKIRAQISLAPIAYMNHMTSPLLRVIALVEGGMEILLNLIGMHEFLPNEGFLHQIAAPFCNEGILQLLCSNALFVITGFNKDQTNTTLLPIILGHLPAGASTKQLLHYGQIINSGKFRQWDYGMLGNLKNYGSLSPPKYSLKKVTAPVYLLYSHNDWLAAERDVLKLYNELGNVQGKFLIADDKWNHLDYLFGIDAVKLVYNKVFSLMSRH